MIRKAYYSIETGRASVRAGYSRENDAQIVELNVRGYGIDLLPSDALKIASALTLAAEAAIRTDDDAASERITHPEPLSSRSSKPKLVLPLQVQKTYRSDTGDLWKVTYDDRSEDRPFQLHRVGVSGKVDDPFNWIWCDRNGVAKSAYDAFTLVEGPIEG